MKHTLAFLILVITVALVGCGKPSDVQPMSSADAGSVKLLAPPAQAAGEVLKVSLDGTAYSKTLALTSQSQALVMANVIKGSYTLRAAIYDVNNVEIENGSVAVQVLPGKVTAAEIKLAYNTGSLDIDVKRAADPMPAKIVIVGMPDTYSPYNNVTVRMNKASDYTVVLSSYQPINWKLEANSGGTISKVIVSQQGTEYGPGTLTGQGAATVIRKSDLGWAYMFRSGSQNQLFFNALQTYLGKTHDGFFGPSTYYYTTMIYVDVNI